MAKIILGLTKSHVDKDVEKLEPLYTADGNAKWYNCFGKQFGIFLNN